ncbi:MAG: hypothetical protein LCH26_06230 [Proteobacteria bacterium]|nr:hypothetical protein [Pseudomonadota bacterium]
MRIVIPSLVVLLSMGHVYGSFDPSKDQEHLTTFERHWTDEFDRIPLEDMNANPAFNAWLDGLGEDGIGALKRVYRQTMGWVEKRAVMCTAFEEGMGPKDLVRAVEVCKGLSLPYMLFPDVKTKDEAFLAVARPLLTSFERDFAKPYYYVHQTRERSFTSEAVAFYAALKGADRDCLNILADASLPTCQLQTILYDTPGISAPMIPPLLPYFQDVRDACVNRGNSYLISGTKTVMAATGTIDPGRLVSLRNTFPTPQDRLTLLEGLGSLSPQKADTAVTLLVSDPGRDPKNLLRKLAQSTLGEAGLALLMKRPEERRRLQLVASPDIISPKREAVVQSLFSGCRVEEEKAIESELAHVSVSFEELGFLTSWPDLTPLQRQAMLRPRFFKDAYGQSLSGQLFAKSQAGQDVGPLVALYCALTNGCDSERVHRITRYFDTNDAGQVATAQALVAQGFSPNLRAVIVSRQLRPDTIAPLKRLHETLTPAQMESFVDNLHFGDVSGGALQAISDAHFDRDVLPIVLENTVCLVRNGWSAPAHFQTLKGLLTRDERWAKLNIKALQKSGLSGDQCAALQALRADAGFVYDLLDLWDIYEDKDLFPPLCHLLTGRTQVEQEAIVSAVRASGVNDYAQTLRWVLPKLQELSVDMTTQKSQEMVLYLLGLFGKDR